MRPNRVLVQDELFVTRIAQNGDGLLTFPSISVLTTVGAGTLLAALLGSGVLHRTGPTAGYADTVDTGANLDTAYPNLKVGDSIHVLYINGVAFASTITAATGVTLKTATANNVVAASTGRQLLFIKTGVGTYDLYVI